MKARMSGSRLELCELVALLAMDRNHHQAGSSPFARGDLLEGPIKMTVVLFRA